jgi:hypothetical protein
MVSRPWAFVTMVIAVLLEQEKRIERVLARVETLSPPGKAIDVHTYGAYDRVYERRHHHYA